MSTQEDRTGRIAADRGVVKPRQLAHVVRRTSRLDELVRWYCTVLGAEVVHADGMLAFLSYDAEHHRIAIAGIPRLEEQPAMAAAPITSRSATPISVISSTPTAVSRWPASSRIGASTTGQRPRCTTRIPTAAASNCRSTTSRTPMRPIAGCAAASSPPIPIGVIFDRTQAGPVLGWTSAVAAYGAFIAPVVIGEQIKRGTPEMAMYGFAVFYGLCLVLNWWFYLRKNAYVKNP